MSQPDKTFTLIDGKRGSDTNAGIPWRNRGFQFGDGVFETMRVVQGKIPLLALHLERLWIGCDRLGLVLHPDFPHWLEAIQVNLAETDSGVARIYIFRTDAGPGNYIQGHTDSHCALHFESTPDISANTWLQDSVELRSASTRLTRNKNLAGIKHLSRIEYCLALKDFIRTENTCEALLFDTEGCVIETPHHNIFAVRGNSLITPSLENVGVKGVMRTLISQLIQQLPELSWVETKLFYDDLLACTEVFLTNALKGVVPVSKCDDQCWPEASSVAFKIAHLIAEFTKDR